MKNVIKKFLFSFTAICLMCSFTSRPVQSGSQMTVGYSTDVTEVGGAFLVFAGKHGGEIRKSELVGQRELKVDGCAKGSRIISYALVITKRGTKNTLEAASNELTKEMVSKLMSLEPGDSFEFKAMRAYLPNGKDIVDVHGEKFVVV